MTLVILAAGMGSRFGGLKQAQVVDEYGNYIIDYSIYDAILAGFKKIVFIIRKENLELFKASIGKRISKVIEVCYAVQELDDYVDMSMMNLNRVKPWGTAHAILCCKDYIDDDFVVINSDDFYGRDAFMVIGKYLQERDKSKTSTYAMVGYKCKNTLSLNGAVKRGVCAVKENYLVKILECNVENVDGKCIATSKDDSFVIDEDETVSMNMFAFTPQIFSYLEDSFKDFLNDNMSDINSCEFLITDEVYKEIVNHQAEVLVLSTDARWLGITYRSDLEYVVDEISKLVQKGLYKPGLWS